jgi:hypothetical protein
MRALIINCTLKPSPQTSNTEALARVVAEAMEKDGVTVDWVRAVDHDIKPGVESDMGEGDAWPAIAGALGDVGFTVPGQAWTYWHLGPGAGPDYMDDQRGHDWAAKTGRAMAQNLVTVARALQTTPLAAPPS